MTAVSLRIRHENDHVVVLNAEGSVLIDIPWESAIAVAHAMTYHAKLIEEVVKRDQIVTDQAILRRAGVNLGIINNPHLQQEALEAAHYDASLRRYLPFSIPSTEKFGVPTVKNG